MENIPKPDEVKDNDQALIAHPPLTVEAVPRQEKNEDRYHDGLEELLFGIDAFDAPDLE